MLVVADANVLFAALIKDSTTRELILSDKLTLATPEFVIDEFGKHMGALSLKTSVKRGELESIFNELLAVSEVKIISMEELNEFKEKAVKISPDPDDVPYFALALKYNCSIWSNDAKLKKQSAVRIFSTKELLEFLK
jgi:predicted nucleic acid-binding protein